MYPPLGTRGIDQILEIFAYALRCISTFKTLKLTLCELFFFRQPRDCLSFSNAKTKDDKFAIDAP